MTETLERGFAALGLDPSPIPQLERFADKLLETNKVMNLTAITEPEQVASLHFLDSLCLLDAVSLAGKSVVDVGTGAGFPGMPLKIAESSIELTLLDSLGKRVDFLRACCDELGLAGVDCIHGRAEEFAADHRQSFDYAVSRAVASLPVLCELCLPLVREGGAFIAMKSSHSDEEIREAYTAIKTLGGQLREVKTYRIPGTDVEHRLVIIDKVGPTPKKYPRRFAQIKKQPLGCVSSK